MNHEPNGTDQLSCHNTPRPPNDPQECVDKPIQIYIGGKYREFDKDPALRHQNMIRNVVDIMILARKIVTLSEGQFYPVYPHTIALDIQGLLENGHYPISEAYWSGWAMDMLRRADCAIFHPNSLKSQGALAEIDQCKEWGKPMYRMTGSSDQEIIDAINHLKQEGKGELL